MARIAGVSCVCLMVAGLLGGCANTGALKALDEKTEATNKELSAAQATLKTACDDIKKAQESLAALQKSTGPRLDALDKRVEKTETDAAFVTRQLLAFKEEMATFSGQFKEMSSSIAQAQALVIKNLENARDIYKTQFLALEEVLQSMKKKTEEPKK